MRMRDQFSERHVGVTTKPFELGIYFIGELSYTVSVSAQHVERCGRTLFESHINLNSFMKMVSWSLGVVY